MAVQKEPIYKISGRQLFSLAAGGVVGGTIIIIANVVTAVSRQDAWLTSLLGVLAGTPLILIYLFLGKQYPDLTWVGLCKKILGRYAGFLVAALYACAFLMLAYHVPWFIGDFAGHIYNETPIYALLLIYVAGGVIALLYGVEAMARATQILITIVSALFFAEMAMVLPHVKLDNLLPVLENGLRPVFKGLAFVLSFTTFPLISLMTIYPKHAADLKQAKRGIIKGYLWGNLIVFTSILMSILVLGASVTAISHYPTYLLAQEINLGQILTRLEFIVATVWLFTEFIIFYLFFYAGVKCLGELLGLKDDQKIILPLGLLNLIFSGVAFSDTAYEAKWDSLVYPPFIGTFGVAIPFILLLVFLIKKWLFKRG